MIAIFCGFNTIWSQKSIETIVIDAGHGGHDPGCHGKFSKEKHVCLSMALKLGKLIKEKYPDLKIVYTRDKDVFVELGERANIANRAKADLFICIHANAASPAAYGTETYVLGLHRSEAQQKVASRENSIIALEEDGGAQYENFDLSPDAIIAKRLQLSVFLDHAITFAQFLQAEFKKLGRRDRGVKQAGFMVLYRTTMPSVLIETGFLTNPNEESFIGKEGGQNKMANAMLMAFDKYKASIEGTEIVDNPTKTTAPKQPAPNPKSEKPEVASEPSFIDKVNQEQKNNGLLFRVQILSLNTKIPSDSPRLKGEAGTYEYRQGGLFKYCTKGFSNDIKAAVRYKVKMREKGFKGAFVVAFLNGERISIEKALKLVEN
ncbi:N-acetylmuramoyl-L-alanine amidase [Crocinitomicaceae bacterium]|nr:N-acetylmuramoyl-L-alanine amidase [Crocinitomicaceae bacterium]